MLVPSLLEQAIILNNRLIRRTKEGLIVSVYPTQKSRHQNLEATSLAGAEGLVSSSPPCPAVVRWLFLLFVFTFPFEQMTVVADFSITKLAGFVFFVCYFFCYGSPLARSPFPRCREQCAGF